MESTPGLVTEIAPDREIDLRGLLIRAKDFISQSRDIATTEKFHTTHGLEVPDDVKAVREIINELEEVIDLIQPG